MSGVCEKYGGDCTGCMDCQDIEREKCAVCSTSMPVSSLDRYGICTYCGGATLVKFEDIMQRHFNDAELSMIQDKLEVMLLSDLLAVVDTVREKVTQRAG